MNGLVICGGESSRMGSDKSMLNYHGIPQRYYIYEMLKSFCDNIYISCNRNQIEDIEPGYSYLVDDYEKLGPMTALIRAYKEAETTWLVIGCDYPYIKETDIALLVKSRDKSCTATTYYNSELNIPEPLLAIYEKVCGEFLIKDYQDGDYSLKQFLTTQKVHFVQPKNAQIIKSVNTQKEFEEAISWLAGTPTKDRPTKDNTEQ